MSDTRWLGWSEIARIAQTRRIVFWGKGEWVTKALPYLPRGAEYIVDNNPYDQGSQYEGLTIFPPDKLKTEPPGEVFVIVTSTGFLAIWNQLAEYGYRGGLDFSVTPTLADYRVITSIAQHDQTVYFSVSDPPKADPKVGGGLYRYRLQSRELTKVVDGLSHGIVEGRDGIIYLADDSAGGVRVLDRDIKTLGVIELPKHARPHGMAYCPKRHRLYVVMPGVDAIEVVDADSGKVLDRLRLSDKYDKAGTPQHHPNDACAYGDSLYNTMFSLSGNWKLGAFDGGVLEWDLDTHQKRGPVATDLWMPHTPTVINGALHWADSMRGEVRNTTWKTLGAFNGFVRGVAYDGVYYYVGQSQHRYIGRRLGTSLNISLDTGLFILDADSKATRFHPIEGIVDINAVYVPTPRAR